MTKARAKTVSVPTIATCCKIVAHLRGGPAKMKDVTALIGEEHGHVEAVLAAMRAANLIQGLPGPTGGTFLTEDADTLDAFGIAEAIYGPQSNLLIQRWKGIDPGDLNKTPIMDDRCAALVGVTERQTENLNVEPAAGLPVLADNNGKPL